MQVFDLCLYSELGDTNSTLSAVPFKVSIFYGSSVVLFIQPYYLFNIFRR